MEGIEKALTVEEVAEQMLRCKLDVHNRIEEINERLGDGAIRMDSIESTLEKHAKQRDVYNKEIIIRIDKIDDWANSHGAEEMDKYDKIIDALNNLTAQLKKTAKDTDANTLMLDMQKKQDEINQAVQEALEKDHAPFKEYKKQAILAVVGVVSVAVLTAVWKLTMFVADMDNLIRGGS